ncbi:MAG: hypothetical protein ABR540_03520, partial [Acidimicrobiales bacterium]
MDLRRGVLRRRPPSGAGLSAAPFADDLIRACGEALAVLGEPGDTSLRLPITVPFDDSGRVVLSSTPPQPDAPRVPAEMEIARLDSGFRMALARRDGQPLLIPGVVEFGALDEPPAPLIVLGFVVTARGMEVTGFGPGHRFVPVRLDE